jgi:hypothetical protein
LEALPSIKKEGLTVTASGTAETAEATFTLTFSDIIIYLIYVHI